MQLSVFSVVLISRILHSLPFLIYNVSLSLFRAFAIFPFVYSRFLKRNHGYSREI